MNQEVQRCGHDISFKISRTGWKWAQDLQLDRAGKIRVEDWNPVFQDKIEGKVGTAGKFSLREPG